MRKILSIWVVLFLLATTGCQKDDFFDKFPPEIMFFQNTKVENADFNQITLTQGTTQYQVKARVSAPFKLKEIKIYVKSGSNETLLNTITTFGSTPTEYFVYQDITGLAGTTDVKFMAWDMDGRLTEKTFKILFN